MQQKGQAFAFGVLFESGLGFVGLGFAWLAGISLAERLQPTQADVERGLMATLPMFLMLVLVSLSQWAPIVEIRQQVELMVKELFADGSVLDIAMVSIAAGVGEEVLFRGALQPWFASWTNPWIALAVVSLLFGLAHAMSTGYFLIATAIGFYFGWLAMDHDDLIAPIVAHTVYDFVAILFFRWRVSLD